MKRLALTLLLGGLAFTCALAGCSELTEIEKNEKAGYVVSVTYDGNGCEILGRKGVTITDMFKPSNYQKDANGTVSIKLVEPTKRKSDGEYITLVMQDYSFVGWYQNAEVRTVDGVPVDWDGKQLELKDGAYYYTDVFDAEGKPKQATPAYNYSGYWDFENDRVTYNEAEDDKISMTLYAAWVPYYEFHYYYDNNGSWEEMSTVTSFDYVTTQQKNDEADTIYVPTWENGNGALVYKHQYQNYNVYTFPSISGTTFAKAYSDANRTQEITESLKHSGTLVVASGSEKSLVVENRIQNVYVEYSEGEQYRITKAEQLIAHATATGYYEIAGDLEFAPTNEDGKVTSLGWPIAFSTGEFSGKIYGKDGKAVTFNNVTVDYSAGRTYGGLFGKITKDAVIENVTFVNPTVNLINTGSRNNGASYGLLAGEIETGATLSVTLTGGTFKIGAIGRAEDLSFHLLANGDTTGVTTDEIRFVLYGEYDLLRQQYGYTIDAAYVTVAEDGTINIPASSDEENGIFAAFYPSLRQYFDEETKINEIYSIINTEVE